MMIRQPALGQATGGWAGLLVKAGPPYAFLDRRVVCGWSG